MRRKEQAIARCKNTYEGILLQPMEFPVVEEAQKIENQKFVDILKKSDKSQVLKQLQQKNQVFDLSWMKEEEQEMFQQLSETFVKDAKEFDEQLSDEDIFQALRNVWIIWMLELLFDKPLHYHEAMFGYSMLYPYSDNFLDDPAHTSEDKKAFNTWFSRRLHGESLEVSSSLYACIDALVGKIEHHFPREQYPSVYDGLYMIQDAQIRSLLQYQQTNQQLIYDISVEKGGTSVIADGYLIDGVLNDEEYQFCVDFGFALQIVDDIQDQIEDGKHEHETLATLCQTKQERESLFQRDWQFFEAILQKISCSREEIKDFVKNSCHELLAQCVLEAKELYSDELYHGILGAMPVEATYMKMIMEETKEKMECCMS